MQPYTMLSERTDRAKEYRKCIFVIDVMESRDAPRCILLIIRELYVRF